MPLAEEDKFEADLDAVNGLDTVQIAAKMISYNAVANHISHYRMVSWKFFSDLVSIPTETAADIAKMSSLKRASRFWPMINPVTFGSVIRGAFDEQLPKSEEEAILWKVANYAYSIVDIGVGILGRDPTVILDVVGLALTLVADIANWDWLTGNTSDFTENTIWLSRYQSFKFEDPTGKWHVFRPLQEGLSENEEIKIFFPLSK